MSKLIFKSTAAEDGKIKISKQDYDKISDLAYYLIEKYGFQFEGGGFYIDGTLNN